MNYVKKTILVTSADSNIAELLRINFTQNGYKVIVAYDGESAYKKIIEQNPGLVIIDILIQKMNILISYLKAKDEREDRSVPILVVIGDSEMKQLFNKTKVPVWVNKPFDAEVVLKKVKEIFSCD
ncbi:MAG: hypothetical protein A2539_03210 [Elusimicrobia bacterium RIFOXYD2_FULL_34_15]|nr:MAG: hypothetical protein A2539_03210 [Elusimicrobia bacterium RIFOXYD2_FULL_34_15]HAM39261.1 hypothetical protein [Elusimicrobiota bacterium]